MLNSQFVFVSHGILP